MARSQTYRVEVEVTLEDRADYSKLMELFEAFIAPIKDGVMPDGGGRVHASHVMISKAPK